jgi:hypothetical protein
MKPGGCRKGSLDPCKSRPNGALALIPTPSAAHPQTFPTRDKCLPGPRGWTASAKRDWLARATAQPSHNTHFAGYPVHGRILGHARPSSVWLADVGFLLPRCCTMVADEWCSIASAGGLVNIEIGSDRARCICRARVRRGGMGLCVRKAAVTQPCSPLWLPGRAWPAHVACLRPRCKGRRVKTTFRGVPTRRISVGNISVRGPSEGRIEGRSAGHLLVSKKSCVTRCPSFLGYIDHADHDGDGPEGSK